MATINAYWACKDIGNVGDTMTSYIISQVAGHRVKHVTTAKPHYMVTGSILQEANAHSTVLGAGLGHENQQISPQANVIFVRGPLTAYVYRKQLGKTVQSLTDPAVVLPLLFKPKVEREHKLGIIPHYVDLDDVKISDGITVISPLTDVKTFVTKILGCETIISSSLHGLIVAHAYNIPAMWVEFSDKVAGGGFKFFDYFMSVNLPLTVPVNLRKQVVSPEIIKQIPRDTGMASYLAAQVFEKLQAHLK